MNRILLTVWLLIALVFTASADRRRLMSPRPVAATAIDYPLDDTATNAYAAWSVGRHLTNAWTGALALVVRSSDGATNYVTWSGSSGNTAALVTWAGTDDVYLTNWFDQTGNARHLLQGNTNLCPRIITNGVAVTQNGYLAMDCRRGAIMSTAALSPSLPLSFLIGVNNDSRTSGDVIFSGNSGTRTAIKQGATAVYRIDSSSALDSTDALTLDTWQAVTAVFTGGDDSIQVNGGTPVTGTAGNNSATALVLGFPTSGADMIFAEAYVWNAAMPDAAGTGPVRTNMATFYAFP